VFDEHLKGQILVRPADIFVDDLMLMWSHFKLYSTLCMQLHGVNVFWHSHINLPLLIHQQL